MNITNRVYIFSVFQSNKTKELNQANHESILERLGGTEVVGKYNGQDELSILWLGDNNLDREVQEICSRHSQECYMVVYYDNAAELVYPDGTRKVIGYLKEYHGDISKISSYTEVDGKYYAVA